LLIVEVVKTGRMVYSVHVFCFTKHHGTIAKQPSSPLAAG
jgi:hypothetical protein